MKQHESQKYGVHKLYLIFLKLKLFGLSKWAQQLQLTQKFGCQTQKTYTLVFFNSFFKMETESRCTFSEINIYLCFWKVMRVIFIITSKRRKNWSLYSWADCLRFQDKRNLLTSIRLLTMKRSFQWAKTLLSNHRIIVATHEEKIIKQIFC